MQIKKALVFGGTGLVGNFLVKNLVSDFYFDQVDMFTRHKLPGFTNKINQIETDFKNNEYLETTIAGDVVFCCLGTTIKKAGSQEAFKKVDLHLPLLIAEIAARKNINTFVVISSIGANPNSNNFYLKTKGQMEEKLLSLNIPNICILRPSLLLGQRKEARFGEKIGKSLSMLVDPLLFGSLKKYKPIHGNTVAKAMLIVSKKFEGKKIIESDEITDIVRNNNIPIDSAN